MTGHRPGAAQRPAFLLAAMLWCAFGTAQERPEDQWHIGGPAEYQDAEFEAQINPGRYNERSISDLLNRDSSLVDPRRLSADPDTGRATPDSVQQPEEIRQLLQESAAADAEAAWSGFGSRDPRTHLQDAAEPYPDDFDSESLQSAMPVEPLTPDRVFSDYCAPSSRHKEWQMLPEGLLFRSYLAGEKEPRMQFLHLRDLKRNENYWEAVLGGRVGILRNGTVGSVNAEGFQVDLEGAVFARVLPSEPSAALAGSDYRAGVLATWREQRTAWKAGYYHISSHVGDEYLLLNPGFNRINYVRDSLIGGTSYDLTPDARIYGEIAWALGAQGGAEPLELQFGAEYAPLTHSRWQGAPFAAVNGHIREEFDFNTGVNIVSGWNWQGQETRHRLRVGLQYYNGPSLQYQFFDRHESLLGGGIWFDY